MAFQSKEIEASGIQIGEEESLKEDRTILTHAKKLMDFARACEETLYSEEGSTIGKIQRILNQGRDVAAIDPSLSHLLKALDSALIQLDWRAPASVCGNGNALKNRATDQ